jgi:predicted dehydrogenase|tara:strand:- start:215 stop:1291 length:1077 start_codon:yes stop_codon:yes gene_type:complete
MKIGIIGFGFMGKTFVHSLNTLKDYYSDIKNDISIGGVVTSSETSAKKINISRYGIEKVYKNIDLLLEDKTIDSIYIASPNTLHYDQIKKCIKANKNILCDKPLTSNLSDSSRLIKTLNSKMVYQMVFEYRNFPAIREIKKLVTKNKIGKVINFRINYLHSGYLDKSRPMSWRLRKGGGAIMDLGPHVIDLVNFIIDDIKSIKGIKRNCINKRPISSSNKKLESVMVDDIAMGLCETQTGIPGFIEVSRLSMGSVDDLNIHISGESGSIKWSLEDLNCYYLATKDGVTKIQPTTNISPSIDFPPSKVAHGWLRAHSHSVYQFVKQVSDKESLNKEKMNIPDFLDGHKVQKLVESFKNK